MDRMRGNRGALADRLDAADPLEGEEIARQTPPPAIGQDERRMQVRAYNHWVSLLEERNYPNIANLQPAQLPDFGPYSVLLDFSCGIENPAIAYLGSELAGECGAGEAELRSLADVPGRSLLTRITDHYMQILANKAPIGFEAEFVNQHAAAIAYRGILLPYSSDDETIDFIFGVINWKELTGAQASGKLLLEIDRVPEPRIAPAIDAPLADWADGPGAGGEAGVGKEGASSLFGSLLDMPSPAVGVASGKAPLDLGSVEAGLPGSTAGKLREIPGRAFSAIAPHGSEFALVLIRRTDGGEVVVLGEVPEDPPLLERAARLLVE